MDLPATLSLPDGPARGGLVALHGSHMGKRDFFLYEHLTHVLPAQGIAVLRYDRRPSRFPTPGYATVRCPVLIFYGEADQTCPIEASIQIWREARAYAGRSTPDVVRLAGCAHMPTLNAGTTMADISPA